MRTSALVLLTMWSLRLGAVGRPAVAIVPLGPVDQALLSAVVEEIRSRLNADVTIAPPREIPASAYYPPRRRYRGDRLLAFLDRTESDRYARVIGITNQDISVTSARAYDWGVLGVARLCGRPGVVSTFRMRAGSASSALLRERLDKVVLHELGHTLGLPHCKTPGCVMHDAEGRIQTVDASTGRFCQVCASYLAESLSR